MISTDNVLPARLPRPQLSRPQAAPQWPPQVEMILTAIETGQYTRREKRAVCRMAYRVAAALRLFSDLAGTEPRELYTRDANARGLGFITPHRFPLGYGGLLDITCPDERVRTIACTLIRCREAAPGWYEGSLYFNRQQPEFAV